MPQEKKSFARKKKQGKKKMVKRTKKRSRAADYAEGKAETKAIRKTKLDDAIKSIKNWKKGVRRNEMPGSGHNPRVGPSGSKPVYPPPKPTK